MSFKATPELTLALWYLIALYITDNQEPTKGEFPILRGGERKPLEKAGFIKYEKRERILETKRKSYPEHIILTEKAWAWAEKNPNLEFPESRHRKHTAYVLKELLQITVTNLQTRGISLKEFLQSTTDPEIISASKEVSPDSLTDEAYKERIREAYSKASSGKDKVRVRLSELRRYLDNLPRAEVDRILGAMELAGQLSLMPLDDPQEIFPEDEKAAIDMGGPKRHILYMKG